MKETEYDSRIPGIDDDDDLEATDVEMKSVAYFAAFLLAGLLGAVSFAVYVFV